MSRIRPVTTMSILQIINIQSTLHSAYGLCKNVSLAVLFGTNGNSHTVSTQVTCIYIYIYILHNMRQWSGKRKKKLWDSSECRVTF